MHSFPLAIAGHLCSIFLCMWAEKTLTRQHLCTVSSKPLLVTCAQYSCVCEQGRLWRDCTCAWSSNLSVVTYAQFFCVCEQGRFWRDYTCKQSPLSLRWSLMLNIFVYVSREDSDETTLVHSLLWAFAGHICSIFLCMWAKKILTKLLLCTVSWESFLVIYAPFLWCEQGRILQDYTCA